MPSSRRGAPHALVSLRVLLFRGRIPGQHSAPFCQWNLGQRLPKSLCITPGEGLSSSTVNVLWGLFNLAIAYLLICRVGSFQLRKSTHVLTLAAGVLLMSLMLARAFGRFHGGL